MEKHQNPGQLRHNTTIAKNSYALSLLASLISAARNDRFLSGRIYGMLKEIGAERLWDIHEV